MTGHLLPIDNGLTTTLVPPRFANWEEWVLSLEGALEESQNQTADAEQSWGQVQRELRAMREAAQKAIDLCEQDWPHDAARVLKAALDGPVAWA